MDINDGASIDALRQQGLAWSEIGRRLGTTENAARHTHRRWRARRDRFAQYPVDPLTTPAAHPRDAAGGLFVPPAVPPDAPGPDRLGLGLKSEIELARLHIATVTRAEIRLRHRLLADREINDTLARRLLDFDKAIQGGSIPSIALRLVTDEG